MTGASSWGQRPIGRRTANKETTMKLTRVILLAIAFAIPVASTQLASAQDEAPAGETEKPAKKKGKKKGKKAEKKGAEEEAAQ
jgi:hypothetical protein